MATMLSELEREPSKQDQESRSGPRGVVRDLKRGGVFRIVVTLLMIAFAALVAYTLGKVLVALFVTDGEFNATPLREAFQQPGLVELLSNTLIIVVSSMVLAVSFGSLFAWIGERTDAALPRLNAIMPMLPFLLPPIAGAIGWTLLLSDRSGFLNVLARTALGWVGVEIESGPVNIYSWWGMIFLYTIYQIPFAYLMIAAGLRNADPALEEQARVCGSSPLATLRKVTIRCYVRAWGPQLSSWPGSVSPSSQYLS